MTLIVYADVILPESIVAGGARGKNRRANTRVENQGGYEAVNVVWGRTLREFELGVVPMLPSAWAALEGIYEVTDAGAYGFLMIDPKDSTVSSGQGFLQPLDAAGDAIGTAGLGYGVPTYQLAKRYTAAGGSRARDRLLTRPHGTPAFLRGGVAITIGAAPGNAAISSTTGVITFVADSYASVTAVSVGATSQVTLASALAGLLVGDRLYLAHLAGADAALLNDKSHTISNITGAGLNVYTLATVTTGKAITVGTGVGSKFPQMREALTWTGAFYVPVHFANDDIDFELVRSGSADARLVAGPSVLVREIRE